MITNEVINEIYKKFGKPAKHRDELQLDYFIPMLLMSHDLTFEEDEIIVNDLDEFNPFRRFLIRALNAILEFDRYIAFVFNNHILFFGKEDNSLQVHMKPERKHSLFDRIFGK